MIAYETGIKLWSSYVIMIIRHIRGWNNTRKITNASSIWIINKQFPLRLNVPPIILRKELNPIGRALVIEITLLTPLAVNEVEMIPRSGKLIIWTTLWAPILKVKISKHNTSSEILWNYNTRKTYISMILFPLQNNYMSRKIFTV